MLANNVQESTTSTGTGSITLAGSSENGRTFSSKYLINQHIDYAIDDGAGNFEIGIGYLPDSTTLVRLHVKDSSNAGALVNFGAGTKQVFVVRDAQHSYQPLKSAAIGATSNIIYPPSFISYSTSYIGRASQMYLLPWQATWRGKISNWAAYVKTASAGAVMRMGIYQVDPLSGEPTGSPLYESDDIDCGVTGLVTSPMSNNTVNPVSEIELPNVFFLAMAFEDSTIRLTSINWTTAFKPWTGVNANGAIEVPFQNFTLGTPTQGVAALPTIGALSSRGENVPVGGFN